MKIVFESILYKVYGMRATLYYVRWGEEYDNGKAFGNIILGNRFSAFCFFPAAARKVNCAIRSRMLLLKRILTISESRFISWIRTLRFELIPP